jgi:hypothetical protein
MTREVAVAKVEAHRAAIAFVVKEASAISVG